MKRIKSDNRGAALVSIIIAMAVVALLGTMIMYTAYSGLNMRLVGRASSNTFYSAEAALDEITAGLEQEMSKQYVNAYTETMSSYGSYSSVSDMKKDFQTEFILDMVDALKQTSAAGTDMQEAQTTTGGTALYDYLYDVSVLDGYVVKSNYDGATVTVNYATAADDGVQGNNLMQTLSDGLILRNIKVTLTKNGYTNTIVTDIKMLVPDVQFSLISAMPDIQDYAYIAGSGIEINGGTTLTLHGNAYSGNTLETDENNVTTGSNDSVTFGTAAKLDATDSGLLIIDGDAVLTAGSSLKTGGQDTSSTKVTTLWADNITAEKSNSATDASNTISLQGRSYVSDDITLNGASNKLILGGQYYGFCSGINAAEESSAIVINGQKTELDFSNLDTLVIAGTAFVDSSTIESGKTDKTNDDVNTGDSLALKSNQYAYMVPTECEGIVTNPMSYDQYDAMVAADADWAKTALNSTMASLNKSIASYDSGVKIVPVFNQAEGGTVYLYLEFTDISTATSYFMDVYNSNSSVATKVKSYMANYISTIKFNADTTTLASNMTRLATSGTMLVPATYDSENDKWTATYTDDTASSGAIASELYTYASTYEALCTKLVTSNSSLTSAEKSRSVFENLIDEEAVNNTATTADDSFFEYTFSDGASKSGNVITFTDSSNTTNAIIVNNEGGTAYETSSGTGIIIATGDVTVNGNWTGLILCKGQLKTLGSYTLTSKESVTAAAMRLSATATKADGTTTTVSVLNLFRGGENYQLPTSNTTNGKDMTDVRNCIAYENWTSQ